MERTRVGLRALKANLSALVARVRAGEEVIGTHRGAPVARLVSVALLYPEARAAVKRARRERRLRDAELKLAVRVVDRLWGQVERILVSVPLAVRAGELAHAFDLRGYDAVHLAAAETLAPGPIVFVRADRDLRHAAAGLGLAVAGVGA